MGSSPKTDRMAAIWANTAMANATVWAATIRGGRRMPMKANTARAAAGDWASSATATASIPGAMVPMPIAQHPGRKTDMELLGLQNFRGSHWAGTFGFYAGPKIACTVIKGAVLEGSVLDGYGAKFDAEGRLAEQGRYRLGVPENGGGPPC